MSTAELSAEEVAGMRFLLQKQRQPNTERIIKCATEGSLLEVLSARTLDAGSLTPDERRKVSLRAGSATDMLASGIEGIGVLMSAYDEDTGLATEAIHGLGFLIQELAEATRRVSEIRDSVDYARLLSASSTPSEIH